MNFCKVIFFVNSQIYGTAHSKPAVETSNQLLLHSYLLIVYKDFCSFLRYQRLHLLSVRTQEQQAPRGIPPHSLCPPPWGGILAPQQLPQSQYYCIVKIRKNKHLFEVVLCITFLLFKIYPLPITVTISSN